MDSKWYKFKKFALTIFGDIKVFPWPMWIIYQPKSFRFKGEHTRQVMQLIEPGDVIMRAYNNYLDGFFIPKGKSRCSHSGIYTGQGKVIHSIAEGVSEIDLIDFCRADRIVVLRPQSGQKEAIAHAKESAKRGIAYDFDFKDDGTKYYCHELTAACYKELHVKKLSQPFLLFFESPPTFLADSFYCDEQFELIYESSGQSTV